MYYIQLNQNILYTVSTGHIFFWSLAFDHHDRSHLFKQPRLFTHDESYETTEAEEEMLTQNSETSITFPKTNIAPENRGFPKGT